MSREHSEKYALAYRSLAVSGARRGISLAASLTANAVVFAKASESRRTSPGIVHTAAVENAVATVLHRLPRRGRGRVTDLTRHGGGADPMWDIFVDKS